VREDVLISPGTAPGWWIVVSWILYALSVNLNWHLGQRVKGRFEVARRAQSWSGWPWIVLVTQLAFFVGLPYLALISGATSPRLMGLTQVDWVKSLTWGLPMGIVAWGALTLGPRWVSRELVSITSRHPRTWPKALSPGLYPWFEAVTDQVHLAFYRAGPALLGLEMYWGLWIGLGMVALEWGLDPSWREGIRSPDRALACVTRAALALATTVIFY